MNNSRLFGKQADSCQDIYSWIDVAQIPQLPNNIDVILFGAGQGSVDLLAYIEQHDIQWTVRCIADNDSTMHGRNLYGIPIVHPHNILSIPHDILLVTTISGKESVSVQLVQMGLVPQIDFLCIGKYPSSVQGNLATALYFHTLTPWLIPEKTVLHVGPGGFLGLECVLHALGMQVISMDAYSFGADYPSVTHRMHEYQNLYWHLVQDKALSAPSNLARFRDLFRDKGNTVELDTELIPYLFPHRLSAIPLADNSVDVVLSFAVLEHVRHPEQVMAEIRRVLRPGGLAIQRILTRDHRSFSKVPGYHALSYLEHTQQEWDANTTDKFYQNRLVLAQWRKLFALHNFTLLHFQPLELSQIPFDAMERIQHINRDLTQADLEHVNCDLIARKT